MYTPEIFTCSQETKLFWHNIGGEVRCLCRGECLYEGCNVCERCSVWGVWCLCEEYFLYSPEGFRIAFLYCFPLRASNTNTLNPHTSNTHNYVTLVSSLCTHTHSWVLTSDKHCWWGESGCRKRESGCREWFGGGVGGLVIQEVGLGVGWWCG